MSFRNGIKATAAALLAFSLAACTANVSETSSVSETSTASSETVVSDEPLKVLCPTGAPALSLLGLEKTDAEIEYVDGQDLLVSELSKTDGEYDIIVAPINAGVKAWQGANAYQLDGVLTWGNLYIVSETEEWNSEGSTLALFGESAIPGLVFNSLYPELNCAGEWYPSVAEASQALLSGQADAALLAQPAAAGAIAKGGEAGKELSVVADLQSEWQEGHESDKKGYPQAGLFVRRDVDASAAEADIASYIDSASTESIDADVDAIGADKLGVPSAKLAASTWQAQNIRFEKASECKTEIDDFLSLFQIEVPEGLIKE